MISSPSEFAAVAQHYATYAELLDEHAWDEWLALFEDAAPYRITTRDNEAHGYPAAIMYCSNRLMLADRVDAGRYANIYRKHVNRHIVGRPNATRDGDIIRASCAFCVVQTEEGGSPFIFAAGKYRDELVVAGEALLLHNKLVILDNARIMTSLPLPL